MEESLIPTPRKNAIPKEVFKDLNLQRRISGGRDSPESGSLYSDYESGQQYEDKDLPSGYNSGEQYDTLSTGYVSGETYELPETRAEPMEPTLASIDEVSVRSNEDMFTLAMPPGFPESNLLQQSELMGSSSSSSVQDPNGLEIASSLEHKKRKKTVSYHVSVPIEKSPLGGGDIRYRDLPSDTDTTSCFDSDGTYMRSEGQSSDSGAALLHHSSRRKGREKRPSDSDFIKGGKKRIKKAKQIIRNHEDFFEMYDNKYWAMARKICFWSSIIFMLACIVGSGVLIALMPRTCDPPVEWWQGSVVLDILPPSGEEVKINLTDLIDNVPKLKECGIKVLKINNLYEKNHTGASPYYEHSLPNDDDNNLIIENVFGDFSLFDKLAVSLHDNDMYLIVEIPVLDDSSSVGIMSFDLEQRITQAIVFWARHGVDGITLLGLENFAKDTYLAKNVGTWKSKFQQYGLSPNEKILTTSFLLPHRVEELASQHSANIEMEETTTKGFKEIVDFSLLDAEIALAEIVMDPVNNNQVMEETVRNATKWDLAPTQPWINWNLQGSNFSRAELAFLNFLPGTITMQQSLSDLLDPESGNFLLISRLTELRRSAVPIHMNGNFKTCHSHCSGENAKEENFKIHLLDNQILLLERFFSRRNRYMVVSNLGAQNTSLKSVSSLYSGGELILDTSDLMKESEFVKFKEAVLPEQQAFVIKFPK